MKLENKRKSGITIPAIILAVQNLSIFFADIIHYITAVQLLCSVLYLIYLIINRISLKIDSALMVWLLYVFAVVLNAFVGGDVHFIGTFVIFNFTMLLLISIPGVDVIEFRIMKLYTSIHLIFSLIAYIVPHSYIDGFFAMLLGSNASTNYAWRVIRGNNAGITTQPGLNATFLSVLIMICAIELIENKKNEIFNLVVLLASFVMIISTGKRFASLAIIPTIALYYMIVYPNRLKHLTANHIIKGVAGAVLVIVFGYWLVNKNMAIQIMLNKISELSMGGDISNGRFGLWEIAWNTFKDNLVLGSGFKSIYATKGLDVHNTYLQILAEAGIIGFAFFALAIISVLSKSKKNLINVIKGEDYEIRRTTGLGYLLMLFLLIYGFVGNTFIDYTPIMLFCMSVVMCLNSKRRIILFLKRKSIKKNFRVFVKAF